MGLVSTADDGDLIKRAFKQILTSNKTVISAAIDSLLKRFAESGRNTALFNTMG